MTPHKHSAGGTLMLDRSFRGIGRIHRASGFTDGRTFRAFNDALTEMAKDASGREWIRAMQRLQIEPIDVWAKYKTGKWREPPRPETAKSLVDAITKWREDKKEEVAAATYLGRNHLITQVKAAARAGATIEELPTVFRAVKHRMRKAPVSFNLIRNYLRAFLRDTVGTRHELYQVVKHDIGAIAIPGHARKKERKRHPLSPADVLLLASKFSTTHPGGAEGAPGHGHLVIEMALLGTHPKEFFDDGWTQSPTYVHIHGEKRPGRDRKVPKLFPSTLWPHPVLKRPTITKHSFERAFAAARTVAKLKCTPLDLRRSFSNWMELAQVSRSRRRIYMGHNPGDVTALYETQEMLQHIVGDGAIMRAWLDEQLGQRPRLVVEEGR